ncbi:arginine--tRNA ligase [bacterium]|nr:arginine--tRNA ligase [bacterium]
MSIDKLIAEKITEAAVKSGFQVNEKTAGDLSVPKQKGHGDLSSNIALVLAAKEKKKPREIAQSILNNLDADSDIISKVEIAGPGFINIFINDFFIVNQLSDILNSGQKFGFSDKAKGKKAQVEFVSANPTGPLSIGHGRQAVIGDVAANLLESQGWDVTREYYFNNAGRQMRKLGESVFIRYLNLIGKDAELGDDHYQGKYITDIARKALQEKGDSLADGQNIEYFQQFAESVIFEDIKITCKRLGIKFDVFFNEKSLYENGDIDKVLSVLREKGLVYDKDGAAWLKTTEWGQDQDRVLVKSTGEPTYRLPDIAYHKNKLERGFDKIVDIFGSDHIATYPDVLAAVKALGYDTSQITVLIHQFVTLTENGKTIKMSTRKANFVTLDELMDEVGVDVTRYFFINRSMSSHLNFDLNLAKTQSDENPVFYVQYAHARICSVINHAREKGFNPDERGDLSLLRSAEEINLAKALLSFPEIVENTAENFELQRLTNFMESVATLYHKFQHAGKVDDSLRVVSADRKMTQARLSLCNAARTVLANGCRLLGVSAPERM